MSSQATVSHQVAQRLRERIVAGSWAPGSTLPAERRLAEDLGVSRGSLRGAIAQLQAEGLVEARQGSGTKVCSDLSSAPVDWVSWLLASEGLPSSDIYEVVCQLVALRRMVAMHIVAQALPRLKNEDVAHLEQLIAAQHERCDDPQAYRLGEAAIEGFFVEHSGNRVVPFLHHALRRCFLARPELVAAFMGPLTSHVVGYDLVLYAARTAVTDPSSVAAMVAGMDAGLEAFEGDGLQRVRDCLEAS